MPFRRDPVSVYYDRRASTALRAAVRRRGQWVTISVPQLSPRASVACLRAGINPYSDDGTGRGISRAVRGFVRALYWQHRHDGTQDGLWLAWEPRGSAPGGWGIAIMMGAQGDPVPDTGGLPWSWPPAGPRRDWE